MISPTLILLSTFVVISASLNTTTTLDNDDFHCNNGGALTVDEMFSCTSPIIAASFSADKIAAFNKYCMEESPRGFDSSQIVEILNLYSFSSDKSTIMHTMEPKALGLNCSEGAAILGAFSFDSDKKDALSSAILPLLTDVESKEGQKFIVNAFTFSSDKKWATALLSKAFNRNCVYGRITAKRVVFLVDVSGSMAATFEIEGQTFTRITYIGDQLTKVVTKGLTPAQSFNLYHFSGGAPTPWEHGLQPWNAANVASAVQFIKTWSPNMPPPPYGTDIYDALQAAYAEDNVLAVYLLTDGFPNAGTSSDPMTIVKAAGAWSKGKTIPTHTVWMGLGHDSSDNKQLSTDLMIGIANATGGVYRALENGH